MNTNKKTARIADLSQRKAARVAGGPVSDCDSSRCLR